MTYRHLCWFLMDVIRYVFATRTFHCALALSPPERIAFSIPNDVI